MNLRFGVPVDYWDWLWWFLGTRTRTRTRTGEVIYMRYKRSRSHVDAIRS
jgi:hypothetical protein